MLVFAFTLQSLPPILPLIIKGLGLSHAEARLLMSLFALSAGTIVSFMVFGPYMTGMVKDRTGSYELSFLFLSILALLVTLTVVVLRIKTVRD